MSSNVVSGSIKQLFTGARSSNEPLSLQITNLKEINNETGKRFRFILNDGEYSCHCVCRPDDTAGLEALGIQKSSIIEIVTYTTEVMGGGDKQKHIIVLTKAKMVQATASRIGSGKSISIDDFMRSGGGSGVPAATETSTGSKEAVKSVGNTKSSGNSHKPQIFAIDQLSPYQNTWTIKARVSYKSPMRTWSNQKGDGKLFSVNFLDETSEIKATAFNDNADKWFDTLQEGKVFYVSRARINPARSQFATLNHPYEISLDRDTEISECDDAADVPKLQYKFVALSEIQNLQVNAIVDVIGIIKEIEPSFQITLKTTGKPYDRRNVVLVDQSKFSINLGLWNKMAVDFNYPENSVIGVKGARVQEFGGSRTLSLTQSGTISLNPDIPEAFQLKGWYDNHGSKETYQSLNTDKPSSSITSDRSTLLELQNLNVDDKPSYHNLKATVNFIKNENFSYPACQTEGCNKKVLEQPDGTWRCEKCDVNHAEPKHRYILSCSIVDHTSQAWVTLFDDSARTLVGMSADELLNLKDSPSYLKHMEAISMNEYSFRVSVRQENYNGVSRLRFQVQQLAKLDYNAECDSLVSSLEDIL